MSNLWQKYFAGDPPKETPALYCGESIDVIIIDEPVPDHVFAEKADFEVIEPLQLEAGHD